METNNSEVTEQVTNQETTADTVASTTKVSSIEAVDTATGEQSSSEVSKDQTSNVEELFYEIQGEEVSHNTVMDWKNGHLMQADYTNKSKANAESKKGLDAKHVIADEKIKGFSEAIDKLEASIKTETDSEEMEDLRIHDTAEYIKRKELLADKSRQAAQARKDLDAKQSAEDLERAVVEHQLLSELNPSWNDPINGEASKNADIELLGSYVKESGFNEQDWNLVQNHRVMNSILKAAKYDALQNDAKVTEKQIADAPNVIKATVKQSVKTKPTTRAERFYGKTN